MSAHFKLACAFELKLIESIFSLLDRFPHFYLRGWSLDGLDKYRVDHMFPPDVNYQIPLNVLALTKSIFVQNIDLVVGYNGKGQFFNKTSPSFCNRLNLHAPNTLISQRW